MILLQVYVACEEEGEFYTVHATNFDNIHIDWFPYRENMNIQLYNDIDENFHEDNWKPLSQSDNSGVTTE
ncbi:hypothetical protein [Vibrio phage PhiImVa-1]|nr:hypothetical protein [Vibrio phage PhiImVa-1]